LAKETVLGKTSFSSPDAVVLTDRTHEADAVDARAVAAAAFLKNCILDVELVIGNRGWLKCKFDLGDALNEVGVVWYSKIIFNTLREKKVLIPWVLFSMISELVCRSIVVACSWAHGRLNNEAINRV
jgi:hypothetical protein